MDRLCDRRDGSMGIGEKTPVASSERSYRSAVSPALAAGGERGAERVVWKTAGSAAYQSRQRQEGRRRAIDVRARAGGAREVEVTAGTVGVIERSSIGVNARHGGRLVRVVVMAKVLLSLRCLLMQTIATHGGRAPLQREQAHQGNQQYSAHG